VREDLDRREKHGFEEESKGLRMERIRSQRYDDASPSSTARQKETREKLNKKISQRRYHEVHTRDGIAFAGSTGVKSFSGTRFLLRLDVCVNFFPGALGGLDSQSPAVDWGIIGTPPGPMFAGTASGRKSLNSESRSGASLNNN
jgi:hypothetical protein